MRLSTNGWLLTLVPLVMARPLHAQPEGTRERVPSTAATRFVWDVGPGAADCPSSERIRGRLHERLGYDPFHDDAVRTLHVRLDRRQGRYLADVSIEEPGRPDSDRRRIASSAPTCAQISDAILLVLVLHATAESVPQDAAEPISREREPSEAALARAPAREETSPRVSPNTVAAPTPPAVERPKESVEKPPLRSWIAGGVVASAGQVPAVTPGAVLAAGSPMGGRWGLVISATYLAAQRAEHAGARFVFSATDGYLAPSIVLPLGRSWDIALHAGPVAGWLHAIPETPQPLDPGDSLYVGARMGASAVWWVHDRLGIGMGIAAQAIVRGWRFHVRSNADPVWEQPPFGGRAEWSILWGS